MTALRKLSLATTATMFLIVACATPAQQSSSDVTAAPAAQRSAAVDTFEMPQDLTTEPSGLQYKVVNQGTGETATKGRKVDVHYTGWLTNGTKFDSSRDRGTPFSFVLGQGKVIRGWDEGVVGMKVGEQRILVIPAELGYGARGAGGVIPPNAILVFKVELVNVY